MFNVHTKRRDVCYEKEKRKDWLSRAFPTDTSQHEELDRVATIEKNQWSLGLRLGSRKKLKDRWFHKCRSGIVNDYGVRFHDWGLSQDSWKSISWSVIHQRIVEIFQHGIEEQCQRSLRLGAKGSDRRNSTKRRYLLAKIKRSPKRPKQTTLSSYRDRRSKWINDSRTHSCGEI